MVYVKKIQQKQVNTNKKKILTFSILFLFIFNVFPSLCLLQTTTQDTTPAMDSINAATEQIPSNSQIGTTATTTPWWNSNWHYRRIYNTTGTGNLSLSMNFTSLLRSLNVINKTFDNSTIIIVRYYTNGTILVVDKTLFNESTAFNNHTNAVGTLTWRVTGVAATYGVYFDVKENRGIRSRMNETLNLKSSGSVHTTIVSTQGWLQEFAVPFNTYYGNNTNLQIIVNTTALAKNLTAHFYCNGKAVDNKTLTSPDNLNWNVSKKFTKIGDWTIRVTGYDDAGYKTNTSTAGFYIGKPDLIALNLTVPMCYVGHKTNVTTRIRAVNTTVQNVTVTLRIDGNNNTSKTNITLQKNENRTLSFNWTPPLKGIHNVSIIIYPTDSNPKNNIIWRKINVEGVPDFTVLNISVSPTPVNEGNPVSVTAYLRNKGDGNATNYLVILYCEQNQDNHTMTYYDMKNSTRISLKKDTSTNVTLTWLETRFGKPTFKGEWAVGIEIFTSEQNPDKNISDNFKALYHVLKVTPAERNPPVLSNLDFSSSIEKGDTLLIGVTAIDESGIDTVVISIRTPNRTYVNATMTPEENHRYEYVFTSVQIGRHNFSIIATDLSPNKNQTKNTDYFMVTEDQTPPTITYFGIIPKIQLPDHSVEIRCIATDYSGIQSAEVTIQFPDSQTETHPMTIPAADTKYVYTKTYESTGMYTVFITVTDKLGNKKTTPEKTFWVTDDLEDKDNDGMPDDWEERYGLNPADQSDASQDDDNDGATNLEEYEQGTNPIKKISSSSEFAERLKENWAYLTASLIVFIAIVLLAVYGIRRRTK